MFHLSLADNKALESSYPQLSGNLRGSTLAISKYVSDDTVDTSGKSAVVDWYYKKQVGQTTVLHYCKYVNDTVLYATENDETMAKRGW